MCVGTTLWAIGESAAPRDGPSEFDPAAWADATPRERRQMARDLGERHLRTGLSAADLLQMLGTPDNSQADSSWLYRLGRSPFPGMDDVYLALRLDRSQRLRTWSVEER